MAYLNASRLTVLVMEFAHLWARVQDLPGDEVEGSSEKLRFDLFAERNPKLAELAKSIQFNAFDRVNAGVWPAVR
jgi:hypothetical protein